MASLIAHMISPQKNNLFDSEKVGSFKEELLKVLDNPSLAIPNTEILGTLYEDAIKSSGNKEFREGKEFYMDEIFRNEDIVYTGSFGYVQLCTSNENNDHTMSLVGFEYNEKVYCFFIDQYGFTPKDDSLDQLIPEEFTIIQFGNHNYFSAYQHRYD